MKKGLILVLLIFFSLGKVNAVDLNDKVEPLTLSTLIDFHPYDRQAIDSNSFSDSGYNASSTLAKTIWIGGFPLVEGIADDVDFTKRPNLMYGNVSVRLISFDGNTSLQISVLAVQRTVSLVPEQGFTVSSTTWRGIFSEIMASNVTLTRAFEFPTANDVVQLSNGSEIWQESYNYLLKFTNSTINYGMFQVVLTSNNNWTYSARVEVEIQTVHNPVFFKIMEDRYMQFYPSTSLVSSVINSTQDSVQISTSLHSSSSRDESSYSLLGLLILPIIVMHRRKTKK
ncbi:MAG: hypothetical protein D6732_02230 [Methanobacteriota archaeon]|nr:MAG: hypothetical protein D6732_02230 [Euryarchaeota archaeon]